MAWTLAIDELMYIPVPLAAGGIEFGLWRSHDEIIMRTPLAMPSSPR